MTIKSKRATAEPDAVPPRRRRYCIRSRYLQPLSPRASDILRVPNVGNKAESQGLVACQKRRKVERRTPCLPREIIFRIFLHLPAEFLYNVVRHVCKEWYDIVSDPHFVSTHLCLSSSAGIIIQDGSDLHLAFYLETDEMSGLKLTEIRFPSSAIVLGSCNGLVLLQLWADPEILHLMNIVTKEDISLPPLVGLCTGYRILTSLASTPAGHYKAVHVSLDLASAGIQLMVCTIGVDIAWRVIDLGDIPMTKTIQKTFNCPAYFIDGFLYWSYYMLGFGFALDVADETIYQFPAPENCKKTTPTSPISMGKHLGLVVERPDGLWRFWKLSDVKSGKWIQEVPPDVCALDDRFAKMFYPEKYKYSIPPSFINGELSVYCLVGKEYALVCYNENQQKVVFSFPLKFINCRIIPFPHVNTLLSPMIRKLPEGK